jgi:hypothetical protein
MGQTQLVQSLAFGLLVDKCFQPKNWEFFGNFFSHVSSTIFSNLLEIKYQKIGKKGKKKKEREKKTLVLYTWR